MNNIKVKNNHFNSKHLFNVFLLILFSLTATSLYSQNNKKLNRMFEEAKEQYSVQLYENAAELCNKILDNNPDYLEAHLLLADIYHSTNDVEKEILQLEKAMESTAIPHIFYRLGNAYYFTGQYEKALAQFEKYLSTDEISETRKNEIQKKIINCRFAAEAIKNPVGFHPERLSSNVNSANNEYWPNLSIDQKELVFTRLITRPGYPPQEDFYISRFDSSGWGRAQPIVEINTSENEGAQVISADGRLLFFTACNRVNGWGSCDIYFSKWINNNWTKPQNAGGIINSSYWEAQPGFSSDGRYLYFASNRPGGQGKNDVWRAELTGI